MRGSVVPASTGNSMKPLSPSTILSVISLLDAGESHRKISTRVGVSVGAVSKVRKLHRPLLVNAIGGRPKILADQDVRLAVRTITSGKTDNAVQTARMLRSAIKKQVGPATVRRELSAVGLKAKVKVSKPLLSRKHRQDRLDFAIAHQYHTEDDWKRYVWSDETKIKRWGSDGKQYVWVRPGEGLSERTVQATLKHGGGSLMVWGAMHWTGPGQLVKIDGIMDGDLYVSILKEDLMASLEEHGVSVDDVIFQHDNDPKHTCKKAKKFLADKGIQVLRWPAQSPDLNPIEHLWEHIKRKLNGYPTQPKGMLELWERVQEVWAAIPAEVCQKLIRSMPARCRAVIKAKGGHTKY